MGLQPSASEKNIEEAFSRIIGRSDQQIVDHRQRWKQPHVLPCATETVADALMELEPIKLGAIEHHSSDIRLHDTADQIEQRRLARPVRADQAENMTGVEREIDAISDDDSVEAL